MQEQEGAGGPARVRAEVSGGELSCPADQIELAAVRGINMRAGDINFQHVHPDAKVSGVYYVTVPPAPPGSSSEDGAIMFVAPRPRAHMNCVQNQTTEIPSIPRPVT
jgi:Putative 2OG-Fe(II) oxygenase